MSKRQSISFYNLLGVSENATTEEIKQAYLNWMQKIAASVEGLPDDDEKRENVTSLVRVLNEIYQVLIDKDLRQQYDKARNQGNEFLFSDGTIIRYGDKAEFDMADFVVNTADIDDNYGTDINSSSIVTTSQSNSSDNESYGENPLATTRADITKKDPTINPAIDDDIMSVIDTDFSEKSEKAAGNGRKVIKGIAIGTIVALIVASIGAIGYLIGKNKKDDKEDSKNSNSVSTTATTFEPHVISSTTTTAQVIEPEYVSPVVNFGDATDPEVVNKKVNQLSELLNKIGIIDPQTRLPYDKEDLKNIILFNNAAFIPENDEQAYAMVNQQLDLTCQVLSTPRVINYINHTAGISTFTEDMVKEDIKNGTDLCLVDSMLLGDSYGYEYLQYLEDSYNELLKITNKDEFVRKYTKVVNSLATVVYGEPFVLNDREYTINDFCGLNNINDGNLLTMYANMLSVLNVDGVNQFVTVKDVDGSDVTVSLEELFSNFDLICVTDKLDIDDNGKIVGNVENFHQRVQVDTINAAIENGYHGNLNAYDYNYNKSLR